MVGDWVKSRTGMNVKIVSIDHDYPILYKPISLTSEILEKNGWIQCKYETCKSLYEYKGLHLRHTMIKRSNGRWVANVDGIAEKFQMNTHIPF